MKLLGFVEVCKIGLFRVFLGEPSWRFSPSQSPFHRLPAIRNAGHSWSRACENSQDAKEVWPKMKPVHCLGTSPTRSANSSWGNSAGGYISTLLGRWREAGEVYIGGPSQRGESDDLKGSGFHYSSLNPPSARKPAVTVLLTPRSLRNSSSDLPS